ncbi:replicative DNA helicase [[Mycoplasma] collis]|uniref:replicative DNA helicase n=1 Tax=[Mycoplasma] collis TaxID=2127 RepID=UPI00051B5641|nr:replicative DNA helicase [[Mycoplasma] collis]
MSRKLFLAEDVENSIIGYLLLNKEDHNKIIPFIEKEDFYWAKNKIIFEAMSELFFASKEIDVISILNWISENINGNYALRTSDLTSYLADTPFYSTLKDIINSLVQKSKLRKAKVAIDFANKEITKNENAEADDILNSFEAKLIEISRGVELKDFQEMQKITDEILNDLIARKSQKDLKGISTGFNSLDQITSGLQNGDLIILAARPSMGKTALALNLARTAVENGKVCAFFSLEMDANQLVTRILSAKTGIEGYLFKKPNLLENSDWININDNIKTINDYKLYIDDSGGLKLHELVWKVKKLQNRIKKIDLIIVDYLQLIDLASSGANRQVEVAKISRKLKQLAREINCPLIALSQLSRKVEERQDKIPLMSDLRESGAIEQDADIVTFLHRPNYYVKNEPKNEIQDTNLIIAKHRNGATGEIILKFDPKIGYFFEE